MALNNKKALLISFLFILVAFSSGLSDTTVELDGANPSSALHKKNGVAARKLLMESLLDYEDACANPKHLPGKKSCKNNP